jgi:DNA processing protein
MIKDAAYWIALAHLPRWTHLRINSLIVKFYYEHKLSPEEFFQLTESDWKNEYGLESREIDTLITAKGELGSNAFMAETLFNEGYEMIPIVSPDYSKTLKENLKSAHAPALIYLKGNRQILCEKSIAIVGSRSASDVALQFTDNIAKLASREYKVVVSGFAKGVDKQALDSAIKYKGQSIIVLPQGVMTFGSGYKTYYRQIVDGDVLVLSTFFPKAPWRVELAMARNPIIYGLASEIYVAESSETGGTWSGVVDGLRKNRVIYVRKPEPGENKANEKLISMGAIAVDFNGVPLQHQIPADTVHGTTETNEPKAVYEDRIMSLLKTGEYQAKEIIQKLNLELDENKLRKLLKSNADIVTINKKPLRYTAKQRAEQQIRLFEQ